MDEAMKEGWHIGKKKKKMREKEKARERIRLPAEKRMHKNMYPVRARSNTT
jgi:hypothetical protein